MSTRSLWGLRPWKKLLFGSLALATSCGALSVAAAASQVDPLDRVQLHRDAGRGVAYLPLAQQGADPGEPMLRMKAVKTIELDGDPLLNTYGGLKPIDVDGDGAFEFVHYNGFRYLQVWAADGRKLWRVEEPRGRIHNLQAGVHRDAIAVLDLDGDGKQDVAHCWVVNGKRSLVLRRGLDGAVIRSVQLEGSTTQECQLAAFRMAATGQPMLLVAHANAGAAKAGCPRNFVGYWARTVAFDLQLTKLWDQNTCDAGHYAWPLDENQDGLAEAVFVGKYLLRHDGTRQCRLTAWPASDHVDSLAIAELDTTRPGLEVVAVGYTGTAMFSAATCAPIWRLPAALVRNPQHLALARLDPTQELPSIVVDEKGVMRDWKTTVITAQGQLVSRNENDVMPMQNANLDGALGVDEKVGSWGRVIDRFGNLRLDRDWYWDLMGTRTRETRAGYYPKDYDRWQAFPLVFDYDKDGRDEIVTWGQSLIVIGKIEDPQPEPEEPVQDDLHWLRYVASHPDLIASLGADAAKGEAHFTSTGQAEGRSVTFDPQLYLDRNPWLNAILRGDLEAATAHYITTGYARGLTWSNTPLHWLRYIASHPDLMARYGALPSAGELDHLGPGQAAGRGITFDPAAYLAKDAAARATCRGNLLCAVRHYIMVGYRPARV